MKLFTLKTVWKVLELKEVFKNLNNEFRSWISESIKIHQRILLTTWIKSDNKIRRDKPNIFKLYTLGEGSFLSRECMFLHHHQKDHLMWIWIRLLCRCCIKIIQNLNWFFCPQKVYQMLHSEFRLLFHCQKLLWRIAIYLWL